MKRSVLMGKYSAGRLSALRKLYELNGRFFKMRISNEIEIRYRDEGRSTRKFFLLKSQMPIGHCRLIDDWSGTVMVDSLWVSPDERGRGYGQLLICAGIHIGFARGARRLRLACEDDGTGRLTVWYRRMGFHQVGINRAAQIVLETPINPGQWPIHCTTKPGG